MGASTSSQQELPLVQTVVKCDVLVAGSGCSGLMAARDLKRKGLHVQVVEANDYLGGRMFGRVLKRNVETKTDEDAWIDMGGQWVGPTQTLFMDLLKELDIQIFPSFGGNVVLHYKGERTLYKGPIDFSVNPDGERPERTQEELEDLAQAWKKISELMAKLPTNSHVVNDPEILKLDDENLKSWLSRNTSTDFTKFALEAACRSIGSAGPTEPREMSMLGFCMAVKAAPPQENPEMYLIHGGAGQVPARLVEEIGAERVQLHCRVDEIDQNEEGVRVTCQNGRYVYEAKYCILAMPPSSIGRIAFLPPLPPLHQQMVKRWPMGVCCKFFATYETPFWKQEELKIAGAVGDLEYIETCADASDPTKKTGIFVGFIVGDRYRKWSSLESENFKKKAIMSDLTEYLGEKASKALSIIWQDWPATAMVSGGYGGFPAIGCLSGAIKAAHIPHGRVIFAGTEISPKWCGYFEGAIISGLEASQIVAEKLL